MKEAGRRPQDAREFLAKIRKRLENDPARRKRLLMDKFQPSLPRGESRFSLNKTAREER